MELQNNEEKHRKNERHSAWERYLDTKQLTTATFREKNFTKQTITEGETSRTTATAWFQRESSKIEWKLYRKNDPRLAWDLNYEEQQKHVCCSVSQISKYKTVIKQTILEAQTHRSPERAWSGPKWDPNRNGKRWLKRYACSGLSAFQDLPGLRSRRPKKLSKSLSKW